ncbi:MAG TPA: hypothetical protein VK471_10690 [Solirubrobacterales bacterium]|nr:hypothetical protein [Solirubrobacterales bacterium]
MTSSEARKGGEASIEEFGAEATGSEKEAILSAFEGYLNALAEEDYRTACSYLSATVQGSLSRLTSESPRAMGCTAILPKLLAPTVAALASALASGQVTKVRVEGGRAFVVFHAPGAELYQQTMVREGEEWKAVTVASSVLVPFAATHGQ